MGMKIDESIRELEKARDSIEPCLFIDEAMDQSMKTGIEIMRKYKKIEKILDQLIDSKIHTYDAVTEIEDIVYGQEEVEDGNDN